MSFPTRGIWRRVIGVAAAIVMTSVAFGGPAHAQWAPEPQDSAASWDFSSFFTDKATKGAGWVVCSTPVRYTVDARTLSKTVARAEIRRLRLALDMWTAASGIIFQFAGRQHLVYDVTTNNLVPEDGSAVPPRTILVDFLREGESPLINDGVVGLAMPSLVLLPSKEIIGGMVVVRASYVKSQRILSHSRLAELYLHEFGHALGLGHAAYLINVMYPELDSRVALGPGDLRGIAKFTRTCAQ